MDDVLHRAERLIADKIRDFPTTVFTPSDVAHVIARNLAEEGLLILDPLPDEDSADFRLLDHEHTWDFLGTFKGDRVFRCTTCGEHDVR